MDLTKMLFGGALVGTLVSCWAHIKSIAWKVCALVLKKVTVTDTFAPYILRYLREHYKYYCLHDRVYDDYSFFTKDNEIYEIVGTEVFRKCSMVFLKGKTPFYYSQTESVNNNVTTKNRTLYFIRNTLDIDALIKEATNYHNKITLSQLDIESNNRFYIQYVPGSKHGEEGKKNIDLQRLDYRIITHKKDNLGFNISKDALDKVILTKENKEIIKLAELWKNNKKWYQSKDIPWKMGWLLHGPPGTGKTALSRRIAEHLNIPMFVYKLGMMGDIEFSDSWKNMQSSTPCMALIEDFDNIFHGRENVVSADVCMEAAVAIADNQPQDASKDKGRVRGKRISFDNLLNTLDGAERYQGVFTIITTNHIDKVDPALLDRPGRIDKVIELTYLNEEGKHIMINKILGDMPAAHSLAMQYIKTNSNEHITPAQLQEKCTELALREFYKESL